MPVKHKPDKYDAEFEKAGRAIGPLDDRHNVTGNLDKLGRTWTYGTDGKTPEQLERMNGGKK